MESESSSSEESAPSTPKVYLPPPEGQFPILKLPPVAQIWTLKLWDLGDLLTLSRVSQRSRKSVKSYTSRGTYYQSFELGVYGNHVVRSYDYEKTYRYPKSHMYRPGGRGRRVYVPDKVRHIKKAIEEWSDVFNKPKISISFEFTLHIRPILELVKRLELYMEEIRFWYDCESDFDPDLYRFAMEQCKQAEKLTWNIVAPEDDFRMEPPIRFQCETFSAYHSNFGVTAENIVEFFGGCKEVDLSFPIPFETLNPFLIQWIAGCRIESFKLSFDPQHPEVPPMGTLFRGIEDYRVVQKVKLRGDKFETAYIIKNVEGREATIAWDQEKFMLECGEVEEYVESEEEEEQEEEEGSDEGLEEQNQEGNNEEVN